MINKVLNFLQRLGSSLMLPIAVLPVAGLMLRLGQVDMLDWPIMEKAGEAIFSNLPMLFAVGLAIGFSVDAAGAAALSGIVAYLTFTTAMSAVNEEINMGVLAGIVSGITGGLVYNKVHKVKLPPYLGFFSGKRCAPICSALAALLLAMAFSYIWPPIQLLVERLGHWMVESGALGAGVFGLLNRLLLSVGLHQILNTFCWFEFGSFAHETGILTGDLTRFFAGDPNAGMFMSGFFPIMIFGLPAVALAIFLSAKPKRRPEIGGLLFSLAFTAFLTGITEPLEYMFMFLAPLLYLFHAILTGLSMAICVLFEYKAGFSFSAGVIDLILSWGKATNPTMIFIIGPVFFALYFFTFYGAIKLFKIKTPGREEEEEVTESAPINVDENSDIASEYAKALGGIDNLKTIDNCITRLRLQVNDMSKIDEAKIKSLGASGIVKMGTTSLQVIIGATVEQVADSLRQIASCNETVSTIEEAKSQPCCTPVITVSTEPMEKEIEIISPVEGEVISLNNVPDPTFSGRLVGDGIAIQPTCNVFVAPISGEIISMPSSGHALVIRHKNGIEVLLHIGIDTVQLKGKGFRAFAHKGMQVTAGTPLIQANWEEIAMAGKHTVSPVLISNMPKIAKLEQLAKVGDHVKPTESLLLAQIKEK